MSVKVHIAGLCLQGNKGGPALLQSIARVLRQHIPDLELVVSVPRHEYAEEKAWEAHYGVVVVADPPLSAFVGKKVLSTSERRRTLQYFDALRDVCGVVDMHGIAYVGPPKGNLKQTLSGRFRVFLLMKMIGKPFIGWTQSYGPLSSWAIRMLAKIDLLSQPFVLCRGEECKAEVSRAFPEAKVKSYPDVAALLPFDTSWGRHFLETKFGLVSDRIVTLSPSAVIYRILRGTSPNWHVVQLVAFAEEMADRGYNIVLVPHTFRPNRHDPEVCDYAVADRIYRRLRGRNDLYLVDDDLPPDQLKSIIANATLHVGARYHSLIAALSAGIPAVSLSWHPKYKDLMLQYGVEEFLYDGVREMSVESLVACAERALAYRDEVIQRLSIRQMKNKELVLESGRLVGEVIKKWL